MPPVLSAPGLKAAGPLAPSSLKQTTRFVAVVEAEKCVGCGVCVPVCPAGAIKIETVAIINTALCTGCGRCVSQCPPAALRLQVA